MDSLLQTENKEKKGVNKILLVSLLVATIAIGAAIWLLSLKPSTNEQQQQLLSKSYQEGTPEFEQYTKDIVIQTDMDNIMQSPTGMGTIMMTIHAKLRNKGQKTINALEVKVGVVDLSGKVIREKKLLVVPKQEVKLLPNQTIPIVATVEGFSRDDDRANVRWKVTAIGVE
jgi:flagellar basal body-associated protein FliL